MAGSRVHDPSPTSISAVGYDPVPAVIHAQHSRNVTLSTSDQVLPSLAFFVRQEPADFGVVAHPTGASRDLILVRTAIVSAPACEDSLYLLPRAYSNRFQNASWRDSAIAEDFEACKQ